MPRRGESCAAGSASGGGILYHAALSPRLDLARTRTPAEVEAQLAAFAAAPWWRGAPRDAVLEGGIARFLATDVGRRLQRAAAAGQVEREVPFTLRMPVIELLPVLASVRRRSRPTRAGGATWRTALEEAWVIVQGRHRLRLPRGGRSLALIDWKTRSGRPRPEWPRGPPRLRVADEDLPAGRGTALGEPGSAWLVFLFAGEVVPVDLDGLYKP